MAEAPLPSRQVGARLVVQPRARGRTGNLRPAGNEAEGAPCGVPRGVGRVVRQYAGEVGGPVDERESGALFGKFRELEKKVWTQDLDCA